MTYTTHDIQNTRAHIQNTSHTHTYTTHDIQHTRAHIRQDQSHSKQDSFHSNDMSRFLWVKTHLTSDMTLMSDMSHVWHQLCHVWQLSRGGSHVWHQMMSDMSHPLRRLAQYLISSQRWVILLSRGGTGLCQTQECVCVCVSHDTQVHHIITYMSHPSSSPVPPKLIWCQTWLWEERRYWARRRRSVCVCMCLMTHKCITS